MCFLIAMGTMTLSSKLATSLFQHYEFQWILLVTLKA